MNPQKRQSKKRKIDPLYLEDYTPVRTIEVTNLADDFCEIYLRGYFEHAAGPVSNISIVNKSQDDQQIRVAYVTFVLAEDAAKLISDPNLQLNMKFNKAENAFQPKIDPNTMKFEDINDDCLLHIAPFLNLIDIANIGKSSTRLFDTVRRFYRKPTHFSYKPMMVQKDMQTILEVIGIHFKSIEWNKLRRTHLGYLSQYCPNVIGLKLMNRSSDLSWSHIVKNKNFFENIITLAVCDGKYTDSEMEFIAASSELKSLQIISCWGMNGTFLSKLKSSCELSYLKIKNCLDIKCDVVLDFVRRNKLVKFSFDDSSLFHRFLSLPAECLSKLEELELNFSIFKDDQLTGLNFSELKQLNKLVLVNKTSFRNCNQLLVAISPILTLKSLTIQHILIDAHTLNCLRLLTNLRLLQLHSYKNGFETLFLQSIRLELPDDNEEKIESKSIADMASKLCAFVKAL